MDLGQLTKANSIEGNKKDNITVIYTPWSNLKKDGSMAVGQVSFKDNKKVKRILVAQRENAIVNRLNKTKVENQPDLKQDKDERLKELRKRDQAAQQARVCISAFISLSLSAFCYATNRRIEKRRSPRRQGTPGKEMAKGPCLRRDVFRGEHGRLEQPRAR